MRSIVVLGDVRVHFLNSTENLPPTKPLYGGALMMHDAIRGALNQSHPLSTPWLYPCSDEIHYQRLLPRDDDDVEFLKGVKEWVVKKSQASPEAREAYRLFNGRQAGRVSLPLPSPRLKTSLSSGDYAGGKRFPDIVVVDDLGLEFGRLNIRRVADSFESFDVSYNSLEAALQVAKAGLDELLRTSREKLQGEINQIDKFRKRIFGIANEISRLVLERLVSQVDTSTRDFQSCGKSFPAEPIFILSATDRIPDLDATPPSGGNVGNEIAGPRNIWQYVHQSPAIRRRAIILLDAYSLRDKLSISSGLSWERTAQDTLVEFQRSRKLRPLLRFGFIVVRFGITGLLLIVNQPHNTSTQTLYFSPEHDDVHFNHQADGTVPGETSVLVATIVEQIVAQCRWREGNAVYQDILPTLDEALLLSVNRMVHRHCMGLGSNPREFTDAMTGIPGSTFRNQSDLIDDAFAATSSNQRRVRNVAVQRIDVAAARSRHDSILSQSCKVDLNRIASDIVHQGADVVFNSIEYPLKAFVRSWVKHAMNTVRSTQPSFTLLRYSSFRLPQSFADCLIDSFFSLTDSPQVKQAVGIPFSRSLVRMVSDLKQDEINESGDGLEKENFIKKIDERLCQAAEELRDHLEVLSASANQAIRELASQIVAMLGQDEHGASLDGKVCDWFCDLQENCDVSKMTNKEIDALRKIERDSLCVPVICLGRFLSASLERYEPLNGWTSAISAPVLKLGVPPKNLGQDSDRRLLVIDRNEIEGIRAVKRLIEQYLHAISSGHEIPRPLSIAVFGPPGSGKSVAVRSIIKMIDHEKAKPKMCTINLSQLAGISDLKAELQKVINDNREGTTPVVFFDEFDSSLDKNDLGWLKYFLAIMEDGDPIKNAIYIFAGGTADSFEAFSQEDRSRSDPDWNRFAQAKGPDFVSRLKGHINVMGVNPSGPDDDLYVIRRAIILRHLLSEQQELGGNENAKIDENMVFAFLHVPYYIHGARSMRMLVELCQKRDTKSIAMSEIPPIHQLNMQVDGKAFVALASGQTGPVKD